MRSKRMLAVVLCLCMVVALMTPVANAVRLDSSGSGVTAGKDSNKVVSSPFDNDLVVQGGSTNGLLNLRNDPLKKNEVQSSSPMAGWEASPRDDVDVQLKNDAPDFLEELKAAAEVYKETDMVRVFVVMETAPLSEQFKTITQVPAVTQQKLLKEQNAVIDAIEENVLSGQTADVRHQLTYLTNSFSLTVQFGNLEEIAQLDGVKSVYILPVYEPCEAETQAVSGGAMTGVPSVWEQLQYTGTGMKIAVIDTGLDLDHSSFAADPALNDSSMTESDIDGVLTKLNAYTMRNGRLTAEDLYRSAKVPYAFNYVDRNLTADHSADLQGDHGTHVSGIAAANEVEGSGVVGMAPDAQIIVMKVFGASGGAYVDDITAALEDALMLGCDVVNMSLGTAAGFSSEDPELDAIYARIAQQDVIVTVAAGNEGPSSYDNLWGNNKNATEHPENGTVGSPATYVNTTVVASVDNQIVMHECMDVNGQKYMYNDAMGLEVTMAEIFAGQTLEYVMIPGLGEMSDYEGLDVFGKVAVVQRGTTNFSQKAANAVANGAVAVIIYNNTDESIQNFGMQLTGEDGYLPDGVDAYTPVVLVDKAAGEALAASQSMTLTVDDTLSAFQSVTGGQMSAFSSWGTTSDLRLLPDITGVGGDVLSCYDDGQYGLMSGTSMAAPHVAGVSALVLQYIHEKFSNLTDAQMHIVADALLMSTAVPVVDADSGVEASPRQQGSGLVSAIGAVNTDAYLTVQGGKPKAELGDGTGIYTFTFQIHNVGTAAKTYALDASLLTEDIVDDGSGTYFMAGMDCTLDGAVTFDCGSSLTVEAGAVKTVTVTVTVSEAGKLWLQKYYPEGGYVEGYVHLTDADENGVNLVLPYMGFCGDWTQSDVFDSAYWYDNTFWGQESNKGAVDGDEYWHVIWTTTGSSEWVLGFNPYADTAVDDQGNIIYDPAYNVLSPNGDGALDGIEEIYLSILRNAKTLTFTYTVGNMVVHEETFDNVRKTMYNSAYGQVVPFLYSWYGTDIYDFAGLANETQVMLTISATVDYADGGEHAIQIPITIDTEAPVLTGITQEAVDGKCYLHITATENIALADVFILNADGVRVLVEQSEFTTENGVYSATVDVTGLGTELVLALCDYACNESYYDVKYTEGGDNKPVMDTSKLYGYRVSDSVLNSDEMYGWVSMSKEDPLVNAHTSDYAETYSMLAAEYVGGMIFAVDAGNNLIYLVPGLWDRNTICQLDYTVIDMAFDHTNSVMYALAYDMFYDSYLVTIDLVTGAVTPVANFGYYYYGPWTLAIANDGTFYSVIQNDSSLYTLSWDADGMGMVNPVEGVTLVDSNGAVAGPNYSQSMTYSAADNMLYWAYYKYSWMGSASELIAISLEDYSQTAMPFHSIYNDGVDEYDLMSAQEIVGLMVMEDDGYVLPESDTLMDVSMNTDSLIMEAGTTNRLKLMPMPWNYELQNVTWESSDESVATVTDGHVMAVSKGTAVITATTEGMSASCMVTVVKISGGFYVYDYYNGSGNYGDMMYVDLADMSNTGLVMSPVDFVAGDYVAHVGEDGTIFGYTAAGQFYRYDLATGEALAIGDPVATVPNDLAYDYTTGILYAATLDQATYESYLCQVNLNNGALNPVGMSYEPLMTLACDADGRIFSITAYGSLVELVMADGYMDMVYVMYEIGNLSYAQTMCYDYVNNVLLWANTETGTVYWIDPYCEVPYMLPLGDPTGSGSFQFACMFTMPEVIPELPYVALESAEALDLFMLVGTTKLPALNTYPLNATNQTAQWVSSDPSVVKVNTDGTLTAVAAGDATISGTIVDGKNEFTVSFQVHTVKGAEKLYGHLMTDLVTSAGQYWVRLYPDVPGMPDAYASTNYVLYSEEYYNGKLYAYGYDYEDWDANWQFMVIDPETYVIESMTEMGEGFPFVYDMTYSYDLGTMFCVAGHGTEATDLYIVDMQTGVLTPYMQTPQMFMSIAAGPDGVLYAIENSVMDYDFWVYGNANLYVIDPVAKTASLVGDTGVKSNRMATMAYDYDSGYLYWTPMFQDDYGAYISGLCMVDPATAVSRNLGLIGAGGAQMTGLYILSENMPQENSSELHTMLVDPKNVNIYMGDEPLKLNITTLPMNLEGVEFTYVSSNESIASVDENGMVTACSEGMVTITVTASCGGKEISCQCQVGVLAADAAFLTYNVTDGGWSVISHKDPNDVTNLNEGENLPKVETIASVGGKTYGIDENGDLFELDTTTLERKMIGNVVPEVNADEGQTFAVVDMAYDSVNNRMLVLGSIQQKYVYDDGYEEIYELEGGRRIYELDLTTGTMTEVYNLYDLGYYLYVMALTVDNDGIIYFYSTYDDTITKLDPATGICSDMISMQSQSYYGDMYCDYALHYDEATGMIYFLFTSNGTVYYMFTLDPAMGSLTLVDYVGDVTYDEEMWSYTGGKAFAGMTVFHQHALSENVTFQWSEDHSVCTAVHVCSCGMETTVECAVTTATEPASCTEDGKIIYTATVVLEGETFTNTYEETLEHTGHEYEDVVTPPAVGAQGYTTHTCSKCGDSFVDTYTPELDPDNSNTGEYLNLSALAALVLISALSITVLVTRRKLF